MYDLIIKYPPTQGQINDGLVQTRENVTYMDIDINAVLDHHRDLLHMGYLISISYDTSSAPRDPFAIAQLLDNGDIPYKATLKLKNKGTYDEAQALARIVESHGYDFDVNVKLRIRDDSSVNFDRESSWFSPNDAFYSVVPNAKSDNINELVSVYEALLETGADVSIVIKPKYSDEATLYEEIAAYPEGTLITFSLKDGNGTEE